MKFGKLLVFGLIIILAVGSFVSVNLIFTKKAEGFIPPGFGAELVLMACCARYAMEQCPPAVRDLCFTDCYEFGQCNT